MPSTIPSSGINPSSTVMTTDGVCRRSADGGLSLSIGAAATTIGALVRGLNPKAPTPIGHWKGGESFSGLDTSPQLFADPRSS